MRDLKGSAFWEKFQSCVTKTTFSPDAGPRNYTDSEDAPLLHLVKAPGARENAQQEVDTMASTEYDSDGCSPISRGEDLNTRMVHDPTYRRRST